MYASENGHTATVTAYRSTYDIDVEFEDGTKRCHVPLWGFNSGSLSYEKKHTKEWFIGQKKMANIGLEMEIVYYIGEGRVNILFEDGTLVTNKRYYNFQRGAIEHPHLNIHGRVGKFANFSCKYVSSVEGNVYYKCKCEKCGLEDILTPQEMIKHSEIFHHPDQLL